MTTDTQPKSLTISAQELIEKIESGALSYLPQKFYMRSEGQVGLNRQLELLSSMVDSKGVVKIQEPIIIGKDKDGNEVIMSGNTRTRTVESTLKGEIKEVFIGDDFVKITGVADIPIAYTDELATPENLVKLQLTTNDTGNKNSSYHRALMVAKIAQEIEDSIKADKPKIGAKALANERNQSLMNLFSMGKASLFLALRVAGNIEETSSDLVKELLDSERLSLQTVDVLFSECKKHNKSIEEVLNSILTGLSTVESTLGIEKSDPHITIGLKQVNDYFKFLNQKVDEKEGQDSEQSTPPATSPSNGSTGSKAKSKASKEEDEKEFDVEEGLKTIETTSQLLGSIPADFDASKFPGNAVKACSVGLAAKILEHAAKVLQQSPLDNNPGVDLKKFIDFYNSLNVEVSKNPASVKAIANSASQVALEFKQLSVSMATQSAPTGSVEEINPESGENEANASTTDSAPTDEPTIELNVDDVPL